MRQQGTANRLEAELATALASPLDGAEWGPAMAALSDRHRAFVLALYTVRPGYGANVKAAKLAGFGTSTSSAKSWSVIASRLAHDEKILEAIREEDQKRIRASAPRAIRALEALIEDPKHKDHARGLEMVLSRTHPSETTHHVKVERTDTSCPGDLTERLLAISLTFGLDPQKVLATPQNALAPPTIDGDFKEVK